MPDTSPARKKRPLHALAQLAWVATIAGACQLLLALLWHDHLQPVSDTLLFFHLIAFMAQVFTFHAGIAMLPVLALAIPTKRWSLATLALLIFLLGAGQDSYRWTTAHLTSPPTIPPNTGLKVMSINAMMGEIDAASTLAQINAEDPDVIQFQEWTDLTRSKMLAPLRAHWPHFAEAIENDAFGQATFSRRPFTEPPRLYPAAKGSEPQICITVDHAGKPLHIQNVHLLPPVNRSMFKEQRERALSLATQTSNHPFADLITGDFNATPRTGIIAAFETAGWHQAHALTGQGRGSSWCQIPPISYAPGIRIDHILTSPALTLLETHTGQPTGSDHLPVIATVDWSKTPQK